MTSDPESNQPGEPDLAGWWRTAISHIEPGTIEFRGHRIQDLLAERSFVEVIWLLVRGGLPTPEQARLLEAALVASVDHGPQAPSIAAARMAATCGVGLNNAIATGVNLLGDVHGGAGQQCVQLLHDVVAEHRATEGTSLADAADRAIARWRARGDRYLPGFGHRFHPVDPRRDPMLVLLDQARTAGAIDGRYVDAGLAIEEAINRGRRRHVPINVDGVTAMIYAELDFVPELARGLFVLGRTVGILSHAWEQTQQGGRIKGPMPPSILPRYVGPPAQAR